MIKDTEEVYPSPFQMLDELYKNARSIMEQKNHDYRGGSGDPYQNFRGATNLRIHPVVGILLRLQDKMMRIQTFVEKGELKVKGESIEDALCDIINYTALMRGMIHEENDKVINLTEKMMKHLPNIDIDFGACGLSEAPTHRQCDCKGEE
jgi:hypothetical protein